jgi:hypothetical protein
MMKIGWTHPVEQTQVNITWGGDGSFCLAFGEQIVGTAIALKYSPRLAWVGLVISDPDYQRRGFARRLMNQVMIHLSDVDSVMLDASVMGYPLYDTMGYQTLYKINAYSGTPQLFEVDHSIRPMTDSDLPAIIAADAEVVGVARPQVMKWLFETGSGYVATHEGVIIGYTFVKTHLDTLRLAGWNARDPITAENLLKLGSNLAAQGGFTYRLNVPEPNDQSRVIMDRHNMTIERYVTRMVYGQPRPGHMSDQFGIVSFMTG